MSSSKTSTKDEKDAFTKLKKAINEGKPDYINDTVYKNLVGYYKEITANSIDAVPAGTTTKTNLYQSISDNVIRDIKYLIYAIENQYVDPDKFLVWIIASVNSSDKLIEKDSYKKETFQMYLLLIALCLRYGGNPNMYVIEPNYGKVHLVIYTLIRFDRQGIIPIFSMEHDFVKQVILIMTLLGANVGMKALYQDDTLKLTDNVKFNRKIIAEATKRNNDNVDNASVSDFLRGFGRTGTGVEIDKKKPFSVLNDNYEDPRSILDKYVANSNYIFPIEIGLMIDDPKYAIPSFGKKEFMPYFDFVLKNNAIRVLQKMIIDDNDTKALESRSESIRVNQAINCIALEAFIELLQRGFKMSYFTMNALILQLLKYIDKSDNMKKFDRVYSEVYISMLKSAVALGVPMDEFQFNYLIKNRPADSEGKPVGDSVKEAYNVPLWKKACETSVKSKLPKSVQLYAASLGINDDPSKSSNTSFNLQDGIFKFEEPTKAEICRDIASLMVKSEEEIKREAHDRLRKKIEVTTPKVSDLVNNRITVPSCENDDYYYGNPLDYNDATLAYYRDKDEKLFCFPSVMYKELLETRQNPYTNTPLPSDLLIKMDKTIQIFKTLQIDTDKVVPVSVAFKKLKEKDQINNERTNYAIETVSMLFYSRGVRKDWLENRKAEDYNKILSIDVIDMKQPYLDELNNSPPFKFAVFCKALYSGIKKSTKDDLSKIPEIMNKIFMELKKA